MVRPWMLFEKSKQLPGNDDLLKAELAYNASELQFYPVVYRMPFKGFGQVLSSMRFGISTKMLWPIYFYAI